jgi:hypothetical protein
MSSIAPINGSPFAVANGPLPNIHNNFNRRIEQHVLTVSVAATVPTLNTALSTGGCTVTDTAAGRIGFTFPLGGTGAIGWVQVCPPNVATPVAVMFSTDSDVLNFATGVGELEVWDAAGAALDITGNITMLINVIKAAP